MKKPKGVARLQVDTRAHGPIFCEACDAENEDVILTEHAQFVCPECGEPVGGMSEIAEIFTSAQHMPTKERPTR